MSKKSENTENKQVQPTTNEEFQRLFHEVKLPSFDNWAQNHDGLVVEHSSSLTITDAGIEMFRKVSSIDPLWLLKNEGEGISEEIKNADKFAATLSALMNVEKKDLVMPWLGADYFVKFMMEASLNARGLILNAIKELDSANQAKTLAAKGAIRRIIWDYPLDCHDLVLNLPIEGKELLFLAPSGDSEFFGPVPTPIVEIMKTAIWLDKDSKKQEDTYHRDVEHVTWNCLKDFNKAQLKRVFKVEENKKYFKKYLPKDQLDTLKKKMGMK